MWLRQSFSKSLFVPSFSDEILLNLTWKSDSFFKRKQTHRIKHFTLPSKAIYIIVSMVYVAEASEK